MRGNNWGFLSSFRLAKVGKLFSVNIFFSRPWEGREKGSFRRRERGGDGEIFSLPAPRPMPDSRCDDAMMPLCFVLGAFVLLRC